MAQLTDPEFLAMRRIAKLLEPLKQGQRRRVLAYANDRFQLEVEHHTQWVLGSSNSAAEAS